MTQKELKETALNSAFQLISACNQIADSVFVSKVIGAVADNDQLDIIVMMGEE